MLYTMLRMSGIALMAFAALALGACSLAPSYTRPASPVPAHVSTDGAGDVNSAAYPASKEVALTGWRDFFKDSRLQKLIATSFEHNRDLKIAVLAVSEARARYGIQRADRLPQLNADGQDEYKGTFNKRGGNEMYEATAVGSFELDFFGRIKSMSDSALETYLASEEAAKTARIALVSQVAASYLAERLARERLALAQHTLGSRRDSYAFIERRVQSGQSSLLDLEQARSLVESATATLAQSEREVAQAGNALQLLIGTYERLSLPEAIPLAEQPLAALPDGVASEVLLARPDVMEAEHRLKSSNADIGAARAAFFPSISLTGSLGYKSDALDQLFSYSTGIWSFLPRITLPLFAGGRNRANLDLADVRKESSVVQYEKTIQTAFQEVADALQSRATYANQFAAQTRYLASQRLVLELAQNRYINGAVSYLEILDAQRSVFQAQQDLLGIRRDQLVNEITLYRALGGGLSENSKL